MITSRDRHGVSPGNFVCEHVQVAIAAWSPICSGGECATTPELARRIDREGRSFSHAIFLCDSYMARFNFGPLGRVPDDFLSDQILEGHSTSFPSVFRTCQGCLNTWLPKRLSEGHGWGDR